MLIQLLVHHDFSGYICIALPGERLEELEIPMMVPNNQDRNKTAYTVTVDYRHGACSFLLSSQVGVAAFIFHYA